MTPSHILVVDDDDRLRALLQRFLREQGYVVSSAANADEARTVLSLLRPDMLVLDVMMPGESGLEFMQWLRKKPEFATPRLPVLMLSAMGETEDRITGLEHGVDDYLAKPFEPRELQLRISAILGRGNAVTKEKTHINFGPFIFDEIQKRLVRGGEPVYLTGGESELLALLVAYKDKPLSREWLVEQLGSGESARNVDVQINRLRRKIEANARQPVYIQTVRGEGYIFRGR